jgi:3-hydroxybutyryl-CoA dehydrogenase
VTCAVLGTGVMGSDVALSLALGGEEVRVWGRRDEGVAESRARAGRNAAFLVSERLERDESALGRITWTTELAPALESCDFACEAVSEELALKQDLLARAEELVHPGAVLASTTSALSPTRLAEPLSRPDRFVVTHYAQPAHLVALVEVVPGRRTSPETVDAASTLLERTGKRPAVCADIPGFLWSRLQQAVLRELVHLLARGDVTADTCDTVVKYGYASRLPAMGPFEHADLAGLELMGNQAREVWPDLSTAQGPDDGPIGELRERGWTGMAAGRGFYDWTVRDPDAFRLERDREIVRRLKIMRGAEVVLKGPEA